MRDLETIIVLVLPSFNFIPQRSHHSLTLPMSRILLPQHRPMSPLFQRVHRPPLLPTTTLISITSVLSKVFERLVSVRLGRFMERSGVPPTTQFAYRKGLGTCDALLCLSHTLQSALERGQEARIVQIDFSAAFDRVTHQGILYKLCSVCIGDSVLSILTQFRSDRSQHVMVDGCRSKLVNVVSRVPQDSLFGPLLFLLYTSELFFLFWRTS